MPAADIGPKLVSKYDVIIIDGTECSNGFRTFGLTSSTTYEDASGFSDTGNDEELPGGRAQGFAGEMFYTETMAALVWPIHDNEEEVEIFWQPDGWRNPSALAYYAICTIGEFSPSNNRGSVSTSPFNARSADPTGVTQATGT